MPSQPLQRHRPLPRTGGRKAAQVPTFLLLAAVLAAHFACSSAAVPPPAREPVREPDPLVLAEADRPYVIDPLQGYAPEADPERRERLESVWRTLLQAGDVSGATEAAAELLEDDPGFQPAHVLAAQVDFAAGEDRAVVDRLLPVGDAMKDYTASQLLVGRSAERLGDVALAYAAFRAVATRSPLALKRTRDLHPRAVEVVANRLDEALRQTLIEEAEKQLALLRAWAPSEAATLDGARSVAVARGDRVAELAAVQALASRRPDDRELLERRAELELEVGDPSSGLSIAQGLAARYPKDPELAENLESAKFRWRLSQLPRGVQEVAAKPDLRKSDFAVLLYWLVPGVRNSRPTSGRIATDVLDHPQQEEIVRVVNLGLMDVDSTLHRFSPGASMRRGAALRSVLRLLSRFGAGACQGDGGGQASTCEASLRCALIPSEEDCQANAPLSGSEGVEIIRRSLKLLGGS